MSVLNVSRNRVGQLPSFRLPRILWPALWIVLGSGCQESGRSESWEKLLPDPGASGDGPELLAPGLISTGAHELDFTMTPDGGEIFFTRAGPDWTSMILTLRRDDHGWTGPFIASFSPGTGAVYPFAAPDGVRVFFDFREALTDFGHEGMNSNLYVSNRTEDGWTPGRPLDSIINTENTEMFTGVALNGNLYFSANYESSAGGFDIYLAEAGENGFESPENLGPNVNSPANEFHAFISPDESYILFDTDRPSGFGGNDLFISFKNPDGSWAPAVNLGDRVNTTASESRPFVSHDGRFLFFCSNRTLPSPTARADTDTYEAFRDRISGPGNGNQDIYWMSAGIIEELRTSLGFHQD